MAPERVDQRRVRGERTRTEILGIAADIASRQGLDALTLGTLADAVQMSKSGVVRHFGSKEQLQIATIDHASAIFASCVLASAEQHEPGLQRLRAVVTSWLEYLVGPTFSGGCFFYAAAADVDRRPGPLREAIVPVVRTGLRLLRDDLSAAVAADDLEPGTDVEQVLFELHAYLQEVSLSHLLLDDEAAQVRGAVAIERLLSRHAAPARNT